MALLKDHKPLCFTIMKKLLFIVIFWINAVILYAHSPQISTITLTQSKDNKWNLIIGSSLSAFQYELKNSYPSQHTDSLNVDKFQMLVIEHLKKNITINANDKKTAILESGMIILGHQTDIRFDVTGMPEKLVFLDLKQLGFGTLKNHYCILTVIIKGNKVGSFILQTDNNYSVFLQQKGNAFVETQPNSMVSWLFWGSVAGVLLVGGFFAWKYRHYLG